MTISFVGGNVTGGLVAVFSARTIAFGLSLLNFLKLSPQPGVVCHTTHMTVFVELCKNHCPHPGQILVLRFFQTENAGKHEL